MKRQNLRASWLCQAQHKLSPHLLTIHGESLRPLGELAEARIAAAGLSTPKTIVPIDEIRNGKPDPEGFLRAAPQLGIPPEECLAFEDTRPGIEAGINAGMQVVGILTTMSADELKHRPLIRDFRDVTIRTKGDALRVELRDTPAIPGLRHRE